MAALQDSAVNSQMQQIPLSQLSIQQLDQIKRDIEQEIGVLSDSLNALKSAQQKFSDSLDNLTLISKENEGKALMVPITSSMYIPGIMDSSEKVLVDIGTGYYAEKTVEEAKKYFRRKIEFVAKQIDKVHPALSEKSKIRNALIEELSLKVSQHMAAQQVTKSPSVKAIK